MNIFSRLARFILKFSPAPLKNAAVRLPFSRFHKLAGWLFSGEELIKLRGAFIKVNPSDNMDYYPYFFGDYSKYEIEKLIQLCSEAFVFADIGANIGLIALPIAAACRKVEVFAFEPDHDIAIKFYDNLSLNQNLTSRVHLIEKGVADINNNLFFRPSTDCANRGIGKIVADGLKVSTDYPVSVVRLDTFFEGIKKYPDVVKIDVEGAELCVLEGMKDIFNRGLPRAMLIEAHPVYYNKDALETKIKMNAILKESGYILSYLKDGRWEDLPPPDNWPGRLHILALKRGQAFK